MSVNGRVVQELGARADVARDAITVDGEPVHVARERRTIVLHKPRGVVSTLDDPEGRPTVRDLLAGVGERLHPVGRLDVNSTGLLLLTNDGRLTASLLHPRNEVSRVYHAKVRGMPSEATITRLRRGVRLEDGKTAPAHVHVLRALPTKTWLEVAVTEGRNRLVRRMCDAVGHPVEKLARVRLGPLALGTLPLGAWRDVTPAEGAALAAAVGLRGRGGGGGGGEPRRGPRTRRRTRRRRSEGSSPHEARTPRPGAPGGGRPAPRRPRAPRGA